MDNKVLQEKIEGRKGGLTGALFTSVSSLRMQQVAMRITAQGELADCPNHTDTTKPDFVATLQLK